MYRRLFAIAAGVLLVGASPAAALNAAQPGIVSNIPAQGTPAVLDGVVNAVAQVGGQIVVGGQFTRVMEANGHVLQRTDIFAFDVATGLVEPAFAPAGRERPGQHALGRARRTERLRRRHVRHGERPAREAARQAEPRRRLDRPRLPRSAHGELGRGLGRARQHALHRRGDLVGRRRGPGAACRPERDHRRRRPGPGARLHRQAGREAARGAFRHQPRRHQARRDGHVHEGRRPRSQPDRDDRPFDDAGLGVVLADRRIHPGVRDPLRHVRPRRQLRSGRLVLRRREHRRVFRRAGRGRDLRLRPAVGERRDGAGPTADMGRLHGRRQPDPGRRDRRRRLRRRPPAVPQQPVRRRHRRRRRREPDGHRRARSAERAALHLEPRTISARLGRVGVPRDGRTACGSEATPTTSTSPTTRASAFLPAAGGKTVPAAVPGALPGDLYTVGAGATPMRRTFDGTAARRADGRHRRRPGFSGHPRGVHAVGPAVPRLARRAHGHALVRRRRRRARRRPSTCTGSPPGGCRCRSSRGCSSPTGGSTTR